MNLGGVNYPVTNTVGRLSHTTAANGYTGTIHSYDVMGRTTSLWQGQPMYPDCWYVIGPATWNYDQAGDLTSYVTPYGITITQNITQAQRVSSITSSVSDATHPPVLAQNLTYTPWGALSGLENGCTGTGCTPYQEIWNFNNRMQPVEIQVGTAANPSSLTCLVYNYYAGVSNPNSCALPSQAATGNNGNVVGIYDQDNYWTSNTHTEMYTYDNLNRLASGRGHRQREHLQFDFHSTDRYGNMTCQTNGSTQGLCPNWSFDTTTNRINSSGFTYDPAGASPTTVRTLISGMRKGR